MNKIKVLELIEDIRHSLDWIKSYKEEIEDYLNELEEVIKDEEE